MPLPFILAGAAVIAGAVGVGGVISANEKNKEAAGIIEEAKDIFDSAQARMFAQKESTAEDLEELGRLKLTVWNDQIRRFVQTFKRIKNIRLTGAPVVGELSSCSFTKENLLEIENVALKAHEIVTGGFAGLGAGGATGIAVYGGVMTLGAASTGTAISSLAGVAASNATLAWLGGGTLSAGGFGVAGGTIALGGIIAGPAILVTAFYLDSKADENIARARSTRAEARENAEQMKSIASGLRGISKITNLFRTSLENFRGRMDLYIQKLEDLIDRNGTEFEAYSEEEQRVVHLAVACAEVQKNLLETPLLTEDGAIQNDCHKALEGAEKFARQPLAPSRPSSDKRSMPAKEKGTSRGEDDLELGKMAMSMDFITQGDLNKAIQDQKVGKAIGENKPLCGYLFDEGKLTKNQVAKILSKIKKRK